MANEVGKIYTAIPAIMAEIGAIGKDRRNVAQGYAYRGIEDFYNVLQPLMVKYKVFSVPEILSKEREERTTTKGAVLIYTTMTVKYTFFAEDGSFVTATVSGEGMDSGDKSANKALSVAHKYALAQIFAVPTADMTDPETESHEVKEKPRPESPPAGIPAEEIQFLKDDLLAYLGHSRGVIAGDAANKLREAVARREKEDPPQKFAEFLKKALAATVEEVKKQEALLAANTNPMAAAVGKLAQSAKESGKVPSAGKQGGLSL
jgi:hypothetical protein